MSWYKTGTVAINNGSTTVTGTGTAWVGNVDVGEGILLPDNRTYEITEVASNTSLTIGRAYLGSNTSGQPYEIQPFRGRIADLTARANSLLDTFQAVRDGIGAGLFPDGSAATPAFRFKNDQDTGIYRVGSNQIGIATGGALRAMVDGSGNVGIGTTSPASRLHISDPGTGLLLTNAAGGDFNIGLLEGVGQPVAYVWQRANSSLAFGTNNLERMRIEASGTVNPGADNTQTLGSGPIRWSVVYAGTGAINTSDEREKHWRSALNEAELRAAKRIIGELGIYQWNDTVAEKGEDGARLHFGVRAQRAFAIMEDEGLDWSRYAWACYDQWEEQTEPVMEEVTVTKTRKVMRPSPLLDPATGQPAMVEVDEAYEETEMRPTGETRVTLEAGDRYGVRPDQLAFWLIAAQAAIQAELEARLAALEAA